MTRLPDSYDALNMLAAVGRLESGELTVSEIADRYGGRVAQTAVEYIKKRDARNS